MLRRHAPRAVKMSAVFGAILLGLGGALGLERFATPYSLALSLFQLAGFATCAWLLASRDRGALLASENRSIGRLAVGALLVIPFVITDFQALAPDMPVRLGALGALLVVTAVLIAEGSTRDAASGHSDDDAAARQFRAARRRGSLRVAGRRPRANDAILRHRHRRRSHHRPDDGYVARLFRAAGAGHAQFHRGLSGHDAGSTDGRAGAPADLRERAAFSRRAISPPTIRRCCAISSG